MRKAACLIGAMVLLFLAGCGGVDREEADQRVVPVSTVTLAWSAPAHELRVSGVVQPWKAEDIGFEVGGRVVWVIEAGLDVAGDVEDENGRLVEAGTVLARLDDRRHTARVRQAESQVAVAKARVAALRIEIERLIPRQLQEAVALRDMAAKERQRLEELRRNEVTSQRSLERAEADDLTARARVAQIEVGKEASQAELAACEAQVEQAEEELLQARHDLASCTLRAPFAGRVATTMVIAGGHVQPGQPVVKLVAMDPIKVAVAVSGEVDRQLGYGDEVRLYPPDWAEPVTGTVFHKGTIADPLTRTFDVSVIVRNFQIPAELWTPDHLRRLLEDSNVAATIDPLLLAASDQPEWQAMVAARQSVNEAAANRTIADRILADGDLRRQLLVRLLELPAATDVWPLQRRDAGRLDKPARFVETGALYRQADDPTSWFVWRVVNMAGGSPHQSLLAVEKVPVEPGEQWVSMFGLLTFRELRRRGGLQETDLLATGLPASLPGDTAVVRLIRRRWLLRPGELMPLLLQTPGPGEGIYVPIEAIHEDAEGRRCVFVVVESEPLHVKKLPVRIADRLGGRVRIDGDGIAAGQRVVRHGLHYLTDGQPVTIEDWLGGSPP